LHGVARIHFLLASYQVFDTLQRIVNAAGASRALELQGWTGVLEDKSPVADTPFALIGGFTT